MKLRFPRINQTYCREHGLQIEDLQAVAWPLIARNEKFHTEATIHGQSLFFKFQPYRHWRDRLLAGLGKSKAEIAFDHALRLAKLGVSCPIPVAVVKSPSPAGALLITERLGTGVLLMDWLAAALQKTDAEIKSALESLSAFLLQLHQAGVYHSDLHDQNIWVMENVFYLLDMEAIRFYRGVNRSRRLNNVLRLARNLGSRAAQVGKEGETFALAFAAGYFTAAGLQPREGEIARIRAQARRGKERWQKTAPACD